MGDVGGLVIAHRQQKSGAANSFEFSFKLGGVDWDAHG